MSHRSDATAMVKRLKREGFEVRLTGSGHWEVRSQAGERVTTFPQTPGDKRWKSNAEAPIRRWKRAKGMNQ